MAQPNDRKSSIANILSRIFALACLTIALGIMSFIAIDVAYNFENGYNSFTELAQETDVTEAQYYLQEAEESLQKYGLLTIIGPDEQEYTYSHQEHFPISIVISDDPQINCGVVEGSYGGGCFNSGTNNMYITSKYGVNEALRALVYHEYAHFLQFNSGIIPPDTIAPGEGEAQIECLANEMAVQLGAEVRALPYSLESCPRISHESTNEQLREDLAQRQTFISRAHEWQRNFVRQFQNKN